MILRGSSRKTGDNKHQNERFRRLCCSGSAPPARLELQPPSALGGPLQKNRQKCQRVPPRIPIRAYEAGCCNVPAIVMTLTSFFAAFVLCLSFVGPMRAEQSPAERVAEIQAALRDAKLDGWLFYDFRHSDPLAYRILKLDENMLASRRWFYYVPASGEPVKIVQSIEQFKLDSLPGKKLVFRGWQELHARLREVLGATGKESKRRIAMQYSPMNDIPYISRVDAGTIARPLVRSRTRHERGTGAKIRSCVFPGSVPDACGSVR